MRLQSSLIVLALLGCTSVFAADEPAGATTADLVEYLQSSWEEVAEPADRESAFFTRAQAEVNAQRRKVAEELLKTERGATAFIQLCESNPELHLRYRFGFLYPKIAEYPKLTKSRLFSDFLMTIPDAPGASDLDWIWQRLDEESLSFQRDVWVEWLRRADPARFTRGPIINSNSPNDSVIFRTAVRALHKIVDPSGIEWVLEDLEAGVPGWLASTALDYLCAMGSPEAFPYAVQEDDRRAMTVVSDEKALDYRALLLRKYGPNSSALNMGNRPDLARGIIRGMIDNPTIMREISLSAPQLRFLIRHPEASSSLGDSELIQFAGRCAESQSWVLLRTALEMIGRHDSPVGNDLLLKWVRSADTCGREAWAVRKAAQLAILRRLIGSNRKVMLRLIVSLPPAEKSRLVLDILTASGRFPEVERGTMSRSSCTGVIPFRKIDPADSPALRGARKFLIRYQSKLLDWINLIADETRLATTYAIMQSTEARRRFRLLFEDGAESAVEAAWTYGLKQSRTSITKAVNSGNLTPKSGLFIKLMLAEDGDNRAYNQLLRDLDGASPPSAFDRRLALPAIIAEIARREDWEEILSRLNEGVGYSGYTNDRCQHSLQQIMLVHILRGVPERFNEAIERAYPHKCEARLRATLMAAACVATPENEELLKSLAPEIEKLSSEPGWRRTNLGRLWIDALRTAKLKWSHGQPVAPEEARVFGSSRAFTRGSFQEILEMVRGRNRPFSWRLHAFSLSGDRGPNMPKDRLDWFVRNLTLKLPALVTHEKLLLLSSLENRTVAWSDGLLKACLSDSSPQIRLTALLFLLKHPRDGFDTVVSHLAETDPLPWCRRVAREILFFVPDPLDPEQGINFNIPGSPPRN